MKKFFILLIAVFMFGINIYAQINETISSGNEQNNFTKTISGESEAKFVVVKNGVRANDDAELLSFVTPTPLVSPDFYNVKVVLINNGVNDLTTCDINYSINGITGVFNWTGVLSQTQTASIIILTSQDFTVPGVYNIYAEVVAPNDENTINNIITQETYVWELGDMIYSNGPLITHPGAAGVADTSRLQQTTLGMGTIGFGHQAVNLNRVADDFTIPAGETWKIDGFGFWAYQTNSTLTSTITGLNVKIWNGNPMIDGILIYDGSTDNSLVMTSWDSLYRDTEVAIGTTSRPLMKSKSAIQSIILTEGTYWIDWQANGSLTSGPWAPPITILGVDTTGDGLQSVAGTWSLVKDGGTNTPPQGFPFEVYGGVYFNVNYAVINGNGSLVAKVVEDTILVNSNVLSLSNINFIATPDFGYEVKEWTVNGEVQAGEMSDIFTYNLDTNIYVTVEFMQLPQAGVLSFDTDDLGTQNVDAVDNFYYLGEICNTDVLNLLTIQVIDDNININPTDVYYKGNIFGNMVYNETYDLWILNPSAPFNWDEGLNTLTTSFVDLDENPLDVIVEFTFTICNGNVTFTVTNGVDPIENATIRITGELDLLTDASGIASVLLDNGDYTYDVSALDYITQSDLLFTVDGEDLSQNIILEPVISINENNALVSISPNPTNGILSISAKQNYEVSVTDITGRVIVSTNMTNNSLEIDLTTEAAGIYIVRLNNENISATYKIIKN